MLRTLFPIGVNGLLPPLVFVFLGFADVCFLAAGFDAQDVAWLCPSVFVRTRLMGLGR